jgi:hypothetical protein
MRYGSLPGALAFDPDGGALAISIRQRVVQIVDLATGEPRTTLAAADAHPVNDVVYLPNDAGLALATTTRRVQIWRLDRVEEELARFGVR